MTGTPVFVLEILNKKISLSRKYSLTSRSCPRALLSAIRIEYLVGNSEAENHLFSCKTPKAVANVLGATTVLFVKISSS